MEENVYVLAFIYTRKATFRLDTPEPDCILKMYLLSLFVAHKFLIEYEMWTLEEFAKLIFSHSCHLQKMELLLVSDLLNFELAVSPEKFNKVRKFLA